MKRSASDAKRKELLDKLEKFRTYVNICKAKIAIDYASQPDYAPRFVALVNKIT